MEDVVLTHAAGWPEMSGVAPDAKALASLRERALARGAAR
jgi:hypothetical protein